MSEELKDQRVTIMLTPSEFKAVEDWSFANRIRSRGEAIRQLIHRGLSVETYTESINDLMDVVMPILARGDATGEEIHRIALAVNTQSMERMNTVEFEQKLKDEIQKARYSHPMTGALSGRKPL